MASDQLRCTSILVCSHRCGANPAAVARVFASNCREMRRLYCHYCQNMAAARQAVQVRDKTNMHEIIVAIWN